MKAGTPEPFTGLHGKVFQEDRFKDDIWELYEVATDFSLVNDLSAKYPEKLKELQELFMKEAEKNYALPIDDRVFDRLIASNVGRPDLMEEPHFANPG